MNRENLDSVNLVVEADVANVAISNPGKRGAFTWRMYEQLEAILTELHRSDALKVVIFRGNSVDGFAAGTDIRGFVNFDGAGDGVAYERRVCQIWDSVTKIPVPTVAVVERYAVGAGLALAVSCDLVLAEASTKFGVPIVQTLGNCLPAALITRLRSRIGPGFADRMLLTAHLFSAEALAPTGFVAMCGEGELDDVATAVTEQILGSAPLSVKAIKEIGSRIERNHIQPPDEDLLELCYGSADFRAGVQAFVEHRRPTWSGS